MRKMVNISVCIFLSLALVGCTNTVPPSSENSSANSSSLAALSQSSSLSTTISSAVPEKIWVEKAVDGQEAVYGDDSEYPEFYQTLAFYSSTPHKEFTCIGVGKTYTPDGYTFFENEELFTIGDLEPEKPIIIKMYMPSYATTPMQGISFVDENKTKHFAYVEHNINDGGFTLVEFESKVPLVWITDARGHAAEYGEDVIDHQPEYGAGAGITIALHTNTACKNLSYSFLDHTFDKNHNDKPYEEKVFPMKDVWLPGEVLYLKAYMPEIFAINGISFDDENGVRRYFQIFSSGLDGSIFFSEFENSPPV